MTGRCEEKEGWQDYERTRGSFKVEKSSRPYHVPDRRGHRCLSCLAVSATMGSVCTLPGAAPTPSLLPLTVLGETMAGMGMRGAGQSPECPSRALLVSTQLRGGQAPGASSAPEDHCFFKDSNTLPRSQTHTRKHKQTSGTNFRKHMFGKEQKRRLTFHSLFFAPCEHPN